MINCDHRGGDDYFGEPLVPTLSSKNLQHLDLIRKRKKISATRDDGQARGDTTVHDKDFNDTDDDDYSTVVPSEDESIDAVDDVRTKVSHVSADKYTAEELEGEEWEETKINSKHSTSSFSFSSSCNARSIVNANNNLNANYGNEYTDCVIKHKSGDDVITAKIVEEEYLFDEKITKFENNPAITKGIKLNKKSELNKVNNLAIVPVCENDPLEKFNNPMNLTGNKNSMMLDVKNDLNCNNEKFINNNHYEFNQTNETNDKNTARSFEEILIQSRISPIHFNHQTENENENENIENTGNPENKNIEINGNSVDENSENNENDGNNQNSIPSHEKNKILKKGIISPGKLFVDTFHEYVDEECSGRRSNESAERSAQHSPSKSKTVTGLQTNNNNNSYKQSMSPLSPRQNGINSFNLSPINIQKKNITRLP